MSADSLDVACISMPDRTRIVQRRSSMNMVRKRRSDRTIVGGGNSETEWGRKEQEWKIR